MTLVPTATHPGRRNYVLKLAHDAGPGRDRLAGRLVNLATGAQVDFDDAEALLAGLLRDLAAAAGEPGEPGRADDAR